MIRYLLDTNIASHIIKGDLPVVRERLAKVPMASICVSAITQAELLYGVAKRGHPEGLTARVREFLRRVNVLDWSAEVAAVYGTVRARSESSGVPLAPLDMLIAAHAVALAEGTGQVAAASTVLVTRDRSFLRVPGLPRVEDWTQAPAQ